MPFNDFFRLQNLFGAANQVLNPESYQQGSRLPSQNIANPMIMDDPNAGGITGTMHPWMSNGGIDESGSFPNHQVPTIPAQQNDYGPFQNDVLAASDQYPAMKKYQDVLNNMPVRGNPSALRAIGTGLYSALQGSTSPEGEYKVTYDPTGTRKIMKKRSGWDTLGNAPLDFKQTTDILQKPYEQKLSDWKNQVDAAGKAATLESQTPNRRALAQKNQATAENIPIKEARLSKEGQARVDQAQQKIDQAQQKLDHVMSREDLTDSEKLQLTNQYKQEQIQAQGDIQKEIQATRGTQSMEQIGARGAVQKDIEAIRNQNVLDQIGARGAQSRETKQTVPGKAPSSAATRDLPPTQQKVAQQLRANKALQEHPEWNGYISTNPNTGMVEIMPPSTGSFWSRGPDKATYDAMVSYMGQATPADQSTNQSTNNQTGRTQSSSAPAQDKRSQAIAILQANGKQVNEQTIKTVMDRMK